MNMGEAAPPSGRKPPHWTTWFFGEMKEMFLLGWPQVSGISSEQFCYAILFNIQIELKNKEVHVRVGQDFMLKPLIPIHT